MSKKNTYKEITKCCVYCKYVDCSTNKNSSFFCTNKKAWTKVNHNRFVQGWGICKKFKFSKGNNFNPVKKACFTCKYCGWKNKTGSCCTNKRAWPIDLSKNCTVSVSEWWICDFYEKEN